MAWNWSSPPPLTYCRLGHAEVSGQGLLGPRPPDRFLDQFSLGQERSFCVSDNRYTTVDIVSYFRYSLTVSPAARYREARWKTTHKGGAEGLTKRKPQAKE